ncbi:DUF1476 domain-containing protein [Kiloniella laminariae]|uniref:DUF1476 domain-containing protein n=1 Tax=Kiloniella laminariae TaxID=454162 RepID=A0ABT4LJS9_9PROT|nr:DUF1476 domain-containing protein [Kiloniella laminariae]MCZ4280606.1 DUF1476 domain-containing protein [Kiloniella laminariae]
MTNLNNREKAFEEKFQHDEELRFKTEARRNKLLGLWAAELMGMTGEAASEYAASVVKADLAEPGEDDVKRKVLKDLQDHNVDKSEHQVIRQMADLMAEAKKQLMEQ